MGADIYGSLRSKTFPWGLDAREMGREQNLFFSRHISRATKIRKSAVERWSPTVMLATHDDRCFCPVIG